MVKYQGTIILRLALFVKMNKHIQSQKNSYTQLIRNFFTKAGFLEVETPIMIPIPGMEPHLTPFETELRLPGKAQKVYLHTSPELQMKKLLGYGFGDIFQITKTFRNTEIGGPQHNPEFTMLEWYRMNADYFDLMNDCENLISNLANSEEIIYQNQRISLKKPWPRITTKELFLQYCNIDIEKTKINDDKYFEIFLNKIEPNLHKDRPIFIYNYPSTQAALAKKSEENALFAERFELYMGGLELANAFSELTDEEEQRERLIKEQEQRKDMKKTIFPIDEEFLASLESIRCPAAGIALGIDRLMMLLLDRKSIEEVLLFPMIKMLDKLNNQS